MKKLTILISMLFIALILSCTTENIEENQVSIDPDFRVTEASIKGSDNLLSRESDDACKTYDLIAGQNYVAGTVSVDKDDVDIIITYTTNEDWIIDLTHLSIGNCDEQWVPTTGSGNPKVGKFEHTEPHSMGTNEVVYRINLEALALQEDYCFAAHAEVQGPSGGETAWADGTPFVDSKSWAMFVEASLLDCEIEGTPLY